MERQTEKLGGELLGPQGCGRADVLQKSVSVSLEPEAYKTLGAIFEP